MISTALALAMSLPLSLQGATETAIAIKNDDPETWTVEYPRVIQPQVIAYRNCLGSSNRMVRGKADFEKLIEILLTDRRFGVRHRFDSFSLG
ncbi:MAG: hypothetical protein AAGK01_14525, partial [Pseudomonadota bacterium]